MTKIVWILGGLVIFWSTAHLHRKYYFLQYLYFLRYPLLLALVLMLLPLTAIEAIGAPLRNLFVHERPSALALVITMALLVAWQTMYVAGYLYEHMPERVKLRYFRGVPAGTPWANPMPRWLVLKRYRFTYFAVLALPVIAASAWYSFEGRAIDDGVTSMGAGAVLLAVAAGILFPLLLAVLLNVINRLRMRYHQQWNLPGVSALPQLLVVLTAWLDKLLFGSTTVETDPAVRSAKARTFGIQMVAYFAGLTFFFYVAISAFPPQAERDPTGYVVPAMTYVLLLIMLIGWLMPWLSFLFDRHRVIPEIALAILVVIFYNVFHTDHFYDVEFAADECPAPPAKPETLDPAVHAQARMAFAQTPQVRPVIVAASGGGITAAYWTAVVLAELESRMQLGPDGGSGFSDSVYMVSGTSGGSVGLLYYADAFSQKQATPRPFSEEELTWIREAAGTSSLSAVGWGLVFRDFWRLVFPPLAKRDEDRATAMEARWVQSFLPNRARWEEGRQDTVQVHNPSFSDWTRAARDGWQPAVAFNSVLVESGELLQISSVGLPALRNDLVRARVTEHQFHDLLPGVDIRAVTAARLSATFPWVTPSARPDLPGRCDNLYHAADGGYYDNFGVISALAYHKALTNAGHNPVFIEIRASDSLRRTPPDADGGLGIALLGPLKTLLAVRGTSQLGRNETLLEDRLGDAERIIFELRGPAPLSWHLAPRERTAIAAQWGESHNQDAFMMLCNALAADCTP